MKPVIGIMPLFDTQRDSVWMVPGYCRLIEENGGIPLILPLTICQETLSYFIDYCDGFLFTGGQDVNPVLYHEKRMATCGETYSKRDEMEIYCMKKIIDLDKPLLGICRGIQLLNVVCEGTLYQDLPADFETRLNHQMKPPYDRPQHEVRLLKDSLLFDILEIEKLQVNSYHHQGIKQLGNELMVAAEAEDQLVEAVYLPNKQFVLGVQWHPEFYRADKEENRKIMDRFLSSCNN